MTYRIEGLSPEPFAALFEMDDAALASRGAMRVTAPSSSGYPCRIGLEDAGEGDRLILLNYVSHDVAGPFRTTHGIYVREGAQPPAPWIGTAPAYLDRRMLSLRGFGADGLLKDALVAMPGEADAKIRDLLGRDEIATIHAHTAAYGCFLARIERN